MARKQFKWWSLRWMKWFFGGPVVASYFRGSRATAKDNFRIAQQRWFEKEPK